MDQFLTLLVTVFRCLLGPRDANVWDGTHYKFKTKLWDRDRHGQLLSSRIPSYIDVSLVKFFIQTRMSVVVRKHGWVPIVLSSVQMRAQPLIPRGELTVHTQVKGWQDQYVEIWHTWSDQEGKEVLRSIYLTRVTHSGPEKVTGADMLEALGLPVVDRPLSQAATRQLSEYLKIKEANRQAQPLPDNYAGALELNKHI
jgi:hypothetical protein